MLDHRALAPPSLRSDEPTRAPPLKPHKKAPFGACGFAAIGNAPPRRVRGCSLRSFDASRLTRPPLRFGTPPLPRFAPRGASRASAVRYCSPTPAQNSEFHAGRSNEGRDPFPSFSSRVPIWALAGPLGGRERGDCTVSRRRAPTGLLSAASGLAASEQGVRGR